VCCTINEPNIVATFGYLTGLFPPGHHDPALRHRANQVFVDAHRKAVEVIRSHVDVPVGMTVAMTEWEAADGGEAMLATLREPMEDVYLEAITGDDFVGVQTYTRTLVGPDGPRLPGVGAATTQMGYEDRPEALAPTIRRAAAITGLPVLVTENGISTDRDERRVEFMDTALRGVLDCMADGVEVLGYIHWSALDNFEWAFGYAPTFGLVAVDRTTQRRRVKPSGRWLGEVAGHNALPDSWGEVRLE
jgi:beta-glucosidase